MVIPFKTPEYPNDSDGDALRRLASSGSDMTKPMLIEFPVVVPAERSAKQFASIASSKGYQVNLWKHEDGSDWEVICVIEMIPTHSEIVRIQHELTDWAKPYDGYCDSWGSFGNQVL